MDKNAEAFLELVRLGIDHYTSYGLPKEVNWEEIENLAAQHGLSAILVDGVDKLSEGKRPTKEVLLQWIGEALQGYEYRDDELLLVLMLELLLE